MPNLNNCTKTKPKRKPSLIFKNCSCVCVSLCTTVIHNIAQSSSDNFPQGCQSLWDRGGARPPIFEPGDTITSVPLHYLRSQVTLWHFVSPKSIFYFNVDASGSGWLRPSDPLLCPPANHGDRSTPMPIILQTIIIAQMMSLYWSTSRHYIKTAQHINMQSTMHSSPGTLSSH